MLGLMMDQPLLIARLIEHADRHHGDTPIVSRRVGGEVGDLHRSSYRELHARARRVAVALRELGVGRSDRVATLAWNGHRHLELYYGVSGSGAVLHTLNPRLHPDVVAWIVNHAEDRVLCFDLSFLALVEAIAARTPSVRHWVALCGREQLPGSAAIPGLHSYEELLAAAHEDFDWPRLDERCASSLCYTSGTTGHPKGVLYSHRSTLLHAYAAALPDAMGLSAADTVMPVVPMFHVNAWGLPYTAALVGARLVLPGAGLDGRSLYALAESEGVSFSAGVPTVWQGLLDHVEAHGLRFTTLKRTMIGGSACPPAMLQAFEENHGVRVLHAWGMTEMSPLGTVAAPKAGQLAATPAARLAAACRQGRVLAGVDMRIVDADGKELPWDGRTVGDLQVRGPWVLGGYYRDEADPLRDGGWFPTGDVATIDPGGSMQITDRTKDLIKSGGEWISSIELEHIAVSHPAVALAACIAVPHARWGERPLLVVQLRAGARASRADLVAHYRGKVAGWQVPDDVVFVDAIPLGATGKVLKAELRRQFRGHALPGAT